MYAMARYSIRTGEFEILASVDENPGSERVLYDAVGYAGKGRYKNDPGSVSRKGEGPLPMGRYTVGPPTNHPRLGRISFPLHQTSGPSFGRSDFWIHGDSIRNPGKASSGCIILSRNAREAVLNYGVGALDVVAG